jgi:hypothetical protein
MVMPCVFVRSVALLLVGVIAMVVVIVTVIMVVVMLVDRIPRGCWLRRITPSTHHRQSTHHKTPRRRLPA